MSSKDVYASSLQTLRSHGSETDVTLASDTLEGEAPLLHEPGLDDVSFAQGSLNGEVLRPQEPLSDSIPTLLNVPEDGKPRQRKRFTFYRHTRPKARRRSVSGKLKENEIVSDRIPGMRLRYHKLKLWLGLIYSIVTLFSWTITCILCYRPIRMATYHDQGTHTRKQYEDNNWWTTTARVSGAIVSAVTISLTSAICAKAAVAYCQTPPDANKKGLSMRQTLALADEGWSDIRILSSLLRPKLRCRVGSPLLVCSALLCGVGIMIPILQGALIDTVHVKTMTREDLRMPLVGEIGWEAILAPSGTISASPGASEHLESAMIQYITDATFTTSFDQVTTTIWTPGGSRQTQLEPLLSPNRTDWFLSLLPAGTDTGVLPQLALRINSSLQCDYIPEASFPSTNPSPNSFNTSFSNIANVSNAENDATEAFSFCVYASDGSDAFSQGNRDRQDISEFLYLDLSLPSSQTNTSLTYQCRLDTTSGYFELPNYWNNHIAGELLAQWPKDKIYQDAFFQSMFNEQNMEQGISASVNLSASINQSVNDTVPRRLQRRTRIGSTSIQGPLMTAAMAIFGSGTFFDQIASANDSGAAGAQTCGQLQQPFMGIFPTTLGPDLDNPTPNVPDLQCEPYRDGLLAQYLLNWLKLLLSPDNLYIALRATTTSASKTLIQPDWHDGGRAIYTSAGTDILKLHMSPGAVAIISVLIVLQLGSLLYLAVYASNRPTWTESLDSFAMLRLGAAMAAELPSISSLEAKHITILDEKEGWVGHQKSKAGLDALKIGGSMLPRNDELYRLIDPGKRVRFYLRSNGGKTTRVYRG